MEERSCARDLEELVRAAAELCAQGLEREAKKHITIAYDVRTRCAEPHPFNEKVILDMYRGGCERILAEWFKYLRFLEALDEVLG